jgi:hypothetical protein
MSLGPLEGHWDILTSKFIGPFEGLRGHFLMTVMTAKIHLEHWSRHGWSRHDHDR